MKFIKRHKFLLIGLAIFLVLIIVGFFAVRSLLYPDFKKNLYGDRLEGIESYSIEENVLTKIKEELTSTGKVNQTTTDIKGRLLNFIVDVKPGTDLVTAKSFGDKILKNLDDKVKTYYDIQLFVTSKDDTGSELYPLIGYKHKTSVNFVWDQEEQ